MRFILTIVLFFICNSFLHAQSKWEMIGAYKYSVFMYSYKLTLTDSENYEIEESSDLGSETTIGTWTIVGHGIWLTPKKRITVDVHKKRDEMNITDQKIEAIEIETKNILAPKERDFKLVRKK